MKILRFLLKNPKNMSKNPKFIPKLQKLDLNSQKLYFLGGCHLAPPTTLHKKKPENTRGHHHIVKKKVCMKTAKLKASGSVPLKQGLPSHSSVRVQSEFHQ